MLRFVKLDEIEHDPRITQHLRAYAHTLVIQGDYNSVRKALGVTSIALGVTRRAKGKLWRECASLGSDRATRDNGVPKIWSVGLSFRSESDAVLFMVTAHD